MAARTRSKTSKRDLESSASQVLSLDAPPLSELPLWGRRVELNGFLVELVPEGERIFNVRLEETFASISFAPAEGTSSLAGDRLRRYERRPYEFIVAPPLFPLKGETKIAPEVLAFAIDFDAMRTTLADALGVEKDGLTPQVVIGGPAAFTSVLAKKIRVQLSADRPADRYLESLCIALLVEMFRPIADRKQQEEAKRPPLDRRAIDMLLAYIDANLDQALAIESLAELVGVSPDRLSRSFKSAIGEAPHGYVIQRRTDAARRLLVGGDGTLADIAYATGFSSQSHMTTAFKNVLGVTPGAIRRRSKGDARG